MSLKVALRGSKQRVQWTDPIHQAQLIN